MKITILCSDPYHPINQYLQSWKEARSGAHMVEIVQKKADLSGGEILFLISCMEVINSTDRALYDATLVLHASDLPRGRGWSPHIWELSQGAELITLCLIEAEDRVDSGRIWKKLNIPIPKHALWDEINHLLFTAEIGLLDYAVDHLGRCEPICQVGLQEATYYPRRTLKDSQIDPYQTLADQFDLIRVCDPNRFPAHFEFLGHRYMLKVEKINE